MTYGHGMFSRKDLQRCAFVCLAFCLWGRLSAYPQDVGIKSAAVEAQADNPPALEPILGGVAPSLNEINAANVHGLRLAFSFRMENPHGFAGAPQVAGSTLFVLTPFPHVLFALDLSRPNAPVKWRYTPAADGAAEGLACCDTINAGPTIAEGRVYINTLDGHTIALDAADGRVIWDVKTADLQSGETLTSSPLVANGKVFIGNAGDDYGARGWIAAFDANTGREVWRHFSTGPDRDVGIGPDFKPFYADSRGSNRGVVTWSSSGWEHGGGSVSGPFLYDPELNLLIHGTGHPAPWNPDQRLGDNEWTSGLFARDADTGMAEWFDQVDPHDLFALGSTGANLMTDRAWRGTARKLLIHPDANGYVYVMDRTTGEILAAKPFVPVTAIRGIDLKTGAPEGDENRASRFDVMTRDVCPGWPGAVGGASALSPNAKFLYIPVNRLCMDMEARNTSFIAGTPFIGANVRMKAPSDGIRGELVAWDIDAGRPAWRVREKFPVASGVLALASGVVFYGTLDGYFKAVDGHTGRPLWQFHASSGIIGQPITYQGPDDHEYIGILAGLGGAFGMAARDGIDKRDATAAHGMTNALQDLPRPGDPGGTLYVFGSQ
jgi:PQQ-dependent dehydrogenase (methanol/ethanol family)